MYLQADQRNALDLMRAGRSDEEVEGLTGLDLVAILSLRATLAASAPQQDARKRVTRPSQTPARPG